MSSKRFWVIGTTFVLLSGVPLAAGDKSNDDDSAVSRVWFTEVDKNDGLIIYDNDDNPWFQKLELGARIHHQSAWIDSDDALGRRINEQVEEFRRSRLMLRAYFLNAFRFDVENDFIDDDRFEDSDADLTYDQRDLADLFLRFYVHKVFDLPPVIEELKIDYGRIRTTAGYESHQNSREILTIERSALADKIRGRNSRATGLRVTAETDDWTFKVGAYSHDRSEVIGGWGDGNFMMSSVEFKPDKDWTFLGDLVLSDPKAGGDEFLDYGWVASLAVEYDDKPVGLAVNAVVGDNGDGRNGNFRPRRQGNFYGFVVIPWVWLVEDRLQLVGRFQHQRSEELEGIRLAPRYLAATEDLAGYELNNGRGNEHISAYAGLNYYLLENDTKIMLGIEYDELDTRRGQIQGMTTFLGFRVEL